MTKVTSITGKSADMRIPEDMEQSASVKYPLHETRSLSIDGDLAYTISRKYTILDIDLISNGTLNLDGDIEPSDILLLKLSNVQGGDRTLSLGTGFNASLADIVVPSGGNGHNTYIRDANEFIPLTGDIS